MRKVRDGTSILGYGYQPPARTPQAEPGRATDAAAYGLHADHSVRLLATNLPGVFTKVRGENQTADPLSIAPLIHSTLLARLQTSETPAARSFRERVLARRWRPEDQIVPVLASRLGVTHQLTARVELADTAFISNNWAGSTIPGTWDNATGIWRVPTVDRPSTPQGSSGGWNSSSWVGIDGTYGSNDVLQAGVQQAVSGGGDASYVPWFEWFVPNQSGPPSYIFQTNIADMRIDPGDEVFCLVQYVGRQGEVLFGNVDRGHYVSLVLAPPPGASFSGNSAEWIVEAPNAGEPTTSLPRFTPVVFSTAVATNPLGTDGNPANGDTTNISRFGAPLTSVSLRQHALEIDYQAPGWLHNLPSAAVGAVPAALGTSPTSWYTTPEDVQHIAYVGTDAQIHELFFRIGGMLGWQHNVPGAAAGAVPVAPGTSPTSWYTTPENVQHVAYVGTDALVHELFFRIGAGQPWLHNVPSAAAGAVPVRAGTSPTSWYTTPENVQHIAYVGTDGLVHELFFFIGGTQGWLHNVPNVAAGAVPVRVGTSPTSWYTTPENVQHIAYVGVDAQVHELFYFIGQTRGWLHNVPSAAQGALPVAPGTSPTSWYTTPENVQHVAYVGTDVQIHELFFRIGAGQPWLHNLPGAAAGAVPVGPGTSPTSWYTTPENVEHVAYVGTDELLHELFFQIG